MKIGVLNSGGDCPGLNAVINGVVGAADKLGWEVYGFIDGFEGLLPQGGDYIKLTPNDTIGIAKLGGTILGTTNKGHFAAKVGEGDIAKIPRGIIDAARENVNQLGIEALIVIGGDGFMLQTLKRNKNSKKLFYGVNSGNYGFLMNKFSSKNIIKNLLKAKMISISPLEMIVKNKNNQIRNSIAINEVSVLRQSRQAASLSIMQGSKHLIKKLVSDGVLVSTPAGSTAYNLSVHGPILSLHSKKLSISPISAFRPRRWKGKIVGDKLKITITNLNPIKRPISAVADNLEVRNAKSISVQTNNKIKFNLLYDKNRSLQKKIKIEQLRKETS